MARTSEEQSTFDRFSKKYRLNQSEVMRKIERSVCGCDYGATSWMTVDEARQVGGMLALKPGKRVLELGSGAGWPSIFLAGETGCDMVMTDLPLTGLQTAMARAATENISGNLCAAVASGAALPFQNASFDAVFHADVLCCLPDKLAALESCRRVLRAGGKMVFSVILITPGLTAADHEQAAAAGPPFIEAEIPYPEMLRQAGWEITDHRDLTAGYRVNLGRMLEKIETHAGEIAALFGEDDASGERARRRAALEALEQGMIRRELFTAVPSTG